MSVLNHDADDSAFAPAVYLADEAATEAFGAALGVALEAGLVIWLTGELGAGKTTLTRGLLRALGHEGNVKSPTYTLVEPYAISRFSLYHFDFYRFNSSEEFLDAGLEEYFGTTGVCLVEWAEKAAPYVPQPDLEVYLEVSGTGRMLRCQPHSEKGAACLMRIQNPR